MKKAQDNGQAVYEIRPADKPYAKIIMPEKRSGLKDRRRLHTFIADDKRSGIADRRKKTNTE